MSWTSIATQNTGGWTGIPNATVPQSVVATSGEPIGLLMALTHAQTFSVIGQPWTSVITQTSGGWTSVATQNN